MIIAAVLLVAATTIAIVSCKKDKDHEKNNNTENLVKSRELSDVDKEMIAFGEKLKTAANERSGESMPWKEALTTLSNYQNYTLCDASHFSTEMLTDTFNMSINVLNGNILLSELNRVYETSRKEILSKYNALNSNQKAVYIVRTVVYENPRSGLDDYTGSLDILVISRMLDSFGSPGLSLVDTTDYWQDFGYGGKCGAYAGQCVGRDCVTQLCSILHGVVGNYGCPNGYTPCFLYSETDQIESTDYPDTHSPNGCYALPWRSFWNNVQCVSPEDMAYYLNQFMQIFYDKENDWGMPLVDYLFEEVPYPRDLNHNIKVVGYLTFAYVYCKPDLND